MNLEQDLAICEAAEPGPYRYHAGSAFLFGPTDEVLIAEMRGWGRLERLHGAEKAEFIQAANGDALATAFNNYSELIKRFLALRELMLPHQATWSPVMRALLTTDDFVPTT